MEGFKVRVDMLVVKDVGFTSTVYRRNTERIFDNEKGCFCYIVTSPYGKLFINLNDIYNLLIYLDKDEDHFGGEDDYEDNYSDGIENDDEYGDNYSDDVDGDVDDEGYEDIDDNYEYFDEEDYYKNVKLASGRYKMIFLFTYPTYYRDNIGYRFSVCGFVLDFFVLDKNFFVTNPINLFIQTKQCTGRILDVKESNKNLSTKVYIVENSVWFNDFSLKLCKKFNFYVYKNTSK